MPNQVNHIRFKLNLSLSGGYISRPKDAVAKFNIPELNDWNAAIVLEPPPEDEQWPGHRLSGYVVAECPVVAELEAFARAFIQRRLIATPPSVTLPIYRNDRLAVGADGLFLEGFRPYLEECPLGIQSLIDDVELKLSEVALRFLHLIRWQQGVDFDSKIISRKSLFWNTGEPEYHIVPSRSQAPFEVGMAKGLEWEERDQGAIAELWAGKSFEEPLGHRLIRSAASLFDDSPEGALLILATALESGVKSHVCFLEPGNRWLLEKAPSPPISRILSEYLPKLYKQKCPNAPSFDKIKPWLDEVKEIFNKRNVTAHTGAKPVLSKPFDHYIEKASDVLYLLDVIEGHEWAKQRLSAELCMALGWPLPPGGFGRLTVQVL